MIFLPQQTVYKVLHSPRLAGMTIDDVREFEQKLHEETNQKVLEGMEVPESTPGT